MLVCCRKKMENNFQPTYPNRLHITIMAERRMSEIMWAICNRLFSFAKSPKCHGSTISIFCAQPYIIKVPKSSSYFILNHKVNVQTYRNKQQKWLMTLQSILDFISDIERLVFNESEIKSCIFSLQYGILLNFLHHANNLIVMRSFEE